MVLAAPLFGMTCSPVLVSEPGMRVSVAPGSLALPLFNALLPERLAVFPRSTGWADHDIDLGQYWFVPEWQQQSAGFISTAPGWRLGIIALFYQTAHADGWA